MKYLKCKQCGSMLEYDSNTRKVVCKYCGASEDVRENDEDSAYRGTALDNDSSDEVAWTEYNPENTVSFDWAQSQKSFYCNSCGAGLIMKNNSLSGECPFCGSRFVELPEENSTFTPTGIIPFLINKDGVISSYRFPIGNNILCPKSFKEKCNPDTFHPMFLPLWVIRAHAECEFEGTYDSMKTSGHFKKDVDEVPVSGCKGFESELNHSDGFFTLYHAVGFNETYLSGYPVIRYDVSFEAAFAKAKETMQAELMHSIEKSICDHYKVKKATVTSLDATYSKIEYKLILIPIYSNRSTHKGKVYQNCVSGQTGVFRGIFPTSFGDNKSFQ